MSRVPRRDSRNEFDIINHFREFLESTFASSSRKKRKEVSVMYNPSASAAAKGSKTGSRSAVALSIPKYRRRVTSRCFIMRAAATHNHVLDAPLLFRTCEIFEKLIIGRLVPGRAFATTNSTFAYFLRK